ncbi:MAG TPA: isoprenylcysteine carboxylmethyltransferase family protein [Alphaproteobacteria bacterium]|nr:isoprenylcysteine carboxylmethyltransferase family protein [Alphaproteobacteria bacterium]
MTGLLTLLYGIVAYAIGLGSIVYAVGFTANLVVPKSIDIGGVALPWQEALLIDLVLLTVFALQHSVMARRGFKRWWTRVIPEPIERSTFVLAAGLVLIALFWFWAPIPTLVWSVDAPAARAAIMAVYFAGWGVLVLSTFLINHFNLFGLSQVFAAWRGRTAVDPSFRTPFLYKVVRHPIYLGLLMAFWAAPDMTVGHLVFSIATTGYILIGIALEERDLIAIHGDLYRSYRHRVRMLLPLPMGQGRSPLPSTSSKPLGH